MSLNELALALLSQDLTRMFSQCLLEARARCLAVAAKFASFERHNRLPLLSLDVTVDGSFSKLWQDLDGDLQYSLSESARPSLPLGTTVATVLGLGMHRRLPTKRFCHLPFPLLPYLLIASHSSSPIAIAPDSETTSQHVLVAESCKANPSLARSVSSSGIQSRPKGMRCAAQAPTFTIQLPQLRTDTISPATSPHLGGIDTPPYRVEVDRYDTRIRPLPHGAQLSPSTGIAPSTRHPVLLQALQPSPVHDPSNILLPPLAETPLRSDR
ncbi:hypothetical protein TRAPUB_7511 [Trametes pubescens]|uniref:Uncharacterized protein n=1 Tax=Trametes pubescens TaxID=154538 RepID=A0A1M2V355_TRAPU|nr:hypothetical protein TRAPUB_7511 [Trametes pubescens]